MHIHDHVSAHTLSLSIHSTDYTFSNSYVLLINVDDDAPTIVNINLLIRSISKIDDYKMVSARWASASHVKYWVCTVSIGVRTALALTMPISHV